MNLREMFAAIGTPLKPVSTTTPTATGTELKPSKKPTPAPKPHTPQFWTPVAVVLWQHTWQCKCGCSGHDTPTVMLRERYSRITGGQLDVKLRLRTIGNPQAYALLPREIEIAAAPCVVQSCPTCFLTGAAHPQVTLPGFDFTPEVYIRTPKERLYDNYAESRDQILRLGTSSRVTL